jgi:TP901 family phage tail tape measure protein
MALADTAQLAVRINLEGNASAGLDKLTRKVNGLGGSVGRAGRGIGQIGAGIAKAGLFVGGAAVAGLTGAAKAAIDFEDAFAGVEKTVNEAELAEARLTFKDLEKSFRGMATEIPIAATEFARLGETAGALGVNAADIDEFVKTTALLGVTTDLTANAAADALGRIGTILKFTGKDYEEFADTLVALGNDGASVESEIVEITKRFAAEGRSAGLATTQIAALASATASLGFAPERGGTALSRVFANMGTNIALANDKGKAFANITGRSLTNLQDSLDKGEGLGIFLDVLEGIKGLSPTDANRTLKALGINNTSDRNIFRTMAENLPFVNDQLKTAANATGALSEEAQKRFDTIASKITLLKNNIVEAGIAIGTAMLPAIGRATESLSAALKDPATKADLAALGEDIGAAIDDIDWKAVIRDAREFAGVLKSALALVLDIVGAVNKLPTEIKAAAAGLLVLNKASGGLIGAGIGNVVGGLAGAVTQGLASRAPGVGRLFAQPVFVTNWPIGGLGGGRAGGGGSVAPVAGGGVAGFLAKAIPIASIVASVAAVIGTQQEQSGNSTAQAAEIKAGLDASIAGKTLPELRTALSGVNQGISDLQSNPLHALVQGDALTSLQSMRSDLTSQIAKLDRLREQADRTKDDTVAAQNRTRDAAIETKRETSRSGGIIAATNRQGSASVVNAIYANRPIVTTIVNVSATTVEKTTIVNKRYGSTSGSRNEDSDGSGTLGNGGR